MSLDLCLIYEQRGENDRALCSARHALGLYRSAGHRIGEAHALDSVGWHLAIQQDYPEALRCCRQLARLLGGPQYSSPGKATTWRLMSSSWACESRSSRSRAAASATVGFSQTNTLVGVVPAGMRLRSDRCGPIDKG